MRTQPDLIITSDASKKGWGGSAMEWELRDNGPKQKRTCT
jgi:hypothetical protein